ncbi:hypothetical protein ONS95_010544 [Cadophora gregata]|uniref:uncharacterized protein n=1 Tax=Cadophora gregata TaxID=51156 RepID=UPI0026DB180B|nr:uncharacterized protein ONS95_010544 [Cadophora gregata]KAK0122298.1 hypothetical protein ONS95_010544 [Cadophora gregata]KAK0127772.1 hypothetical protein ONS96_007283 [Cadophora gregata f. sp. sojae]
MCRSLTPPPPHSPPHWPVPGGCAPRHRDGWPRPRTLKILASSHAGILAVLPTSRQHHKRSEDNTGTDRPPLNGSRDGSRLTFLLPGSSLHPRSTLEPTRCLHPSHSRLGGHHTDYEVASSLPKRADRGAANLLHAPISRNSSEVLLKTSVLRINYRFIDS